MLLAVDIGNTNITLGAFDGDILLFTARLATDKRLTSDQYSYEIKNILSLHDKKLSDVEDCIIASVVPNVENSICKALTNVCPVVPLCVGPGIKTGLNIKIDNPAQLGADLVAGAVGAIARYELPCLVMDLGTATKISVIDGDGTFLGCTIAAGIRISLDALSARTSQLPAIALGAPEHIIGKNTPDCIKAGTVIGTAAMLDGMADRLEKELGKEIRTVVATGGLSREIVTCCERNIIYNKDLVLEGLLTIYRKNRQ